MYVSLAGNKQQKFNNKKLGLTLSLTYDFVKSLGTYNNNDELQGLGVQYRKNGESFMGLFK